MKTARPSLKNSAAENSLIRRVESLERDMGLLHRVLSDHFGLCVCDHCEEGHERFFFPKLDPVNQIWYCADGLLTAGVAWCSNCLNDKWPTLSMDFDSKEYDQSVNDVAQWLAHRPKSLRSGSDLTKMDDVFQLVRKVQP